MFIIKLYCTLKVKYVNVLRKKCIHCYIPCVLIPKLSKIGLKKRLKKMKKKKCEKKRKKKT